MLLLEEERKCSGVISFPDSVFNCFIKSGTFWSRSKRFNLQFSFFGWLTNFHDVNEFFTRFPAVSFVISLSKRPIVHLWSMISEQNSPKGVAYCSRDVGCCANVPKRIVQFHFSLVASFGHAAALGQQNPLVFASSFSFIKMAEFVFFSSVMVERDADF